MTTKKLTEALDRKACEAHAAGDRKLYKQLQQECHNLLTGRTPQDAAFLARFEASMAATIGAGWHVNTAFSLSDQEQPYLAYIEAPGDRDDIPAARVYVWRNAAGEVCACHDADSYHFDSSWRPATKADLSRFGDLI